MAIQHQLDQLLADRARIEERSRAPWWEHVLTGAVAGSATLGALLLSPTSAAFVGAFIAVATAPVDSWRQARVGVRRGSRFGGRRWYPLLATAVVASVLTGSLVILATLGSRHPLFQVGLPVATVVLTVVGSWTWDRWSATRDVVRGGLAPQHVPALDDPVRLRLLAVLATADTRLDTLGELLALDVTELKPHLDALEAAGFVTIRTRRSLVTGDATWAELTYVGRGTLGRHLAELRRRASPVFHT